MQSNLLEGIYKRKGIDMSVDNYNSKYIVEDDGIYVIVKDNGDMNCITMQILPKEIFVEAYEKYIKENDNADSN